MHPQASGETVCAVSHASPSVDLFPHPRPPSSLARTFSPSRWPPSGQSMLSSHTEHYPAVHRAHYALCSPPITYRTRPLVRQTEGSGLGMRSYPFLRPGYGMGLLCNVPLPHTAAQRLLENYPVVENIFYEVGRKYDASTDGRELVNLMLVTKAFHHHAASLLWSDLGHRGLRPLLRIIAVMSIPEFQGGTRYAEPTRSYAARRLIFPV